MCGCREIFIITRLYCASAKLPLSHQPLRLSNFADERDLHQICGEIKRTRIAEISTSQYSSSNGSPAAFLYPLSLFFFSSSSSWVNFCHRKKLSWALTLRKFRLKEPPEKIEYLFFFFYLLVSSTRWWFVFETFFFSRFRVEFSLVVCKNLRNTFVIRRISEIFLLARLLLDSSGEYLQQREIQSNDTNPPVTNNILYKHSIYKRKKKKHKSTRILSLSFPQSW